MNPALIHDLVALLVVAQLAAPALALIAIGIPLILGRSLREQTTTRLVGAGFAVAFVAASEARPRSLRRCLKTSVTPTWSSR